MTPQYQRGQLLLQQHRPEQAADAFREHLGEVPGDPIAHALLSICLMQIGRKDEALQESETAIGLGADIAYCHYVRAAVLHDINRNKDAEPAVAEALRLDPYNADAFALKGHIAAARSKWADVLVAAEEGLAADPDHVSCANLRAVALVHLGRRDEAGQTIDATLARHPDNAMTHANMGWTLLHQGDPRKAAEHFREALRLDPTSEWARAGIVEALKARNFVYRFLLAYFLWMARMPGGARWGLMIGMIVGVNLVDSIPRSSTAVTVMVETVVLGYVLFVMLVWSAEPLFNLLLRLDKFGRLALSDAQRRMSTFFGLGLAVTVGLVAQMWVEVSYSAATLFIPLLLPLAVATQVRRFGSSTVPVLIAAGVFAMAIAGVVMLHTNNESVVGMGIDLVKNVPVICAISTWVGVGVAAKNR